jgi:predicted aspartyl protease
MSEIRRIRRLAILPLILVLHGCPLEQRVEVEAPADTLAGEIPVTFMGTNDAALTVAVHVNGEGPWDFVLDTGATMTCVDRDLVERLGLPTRRGMVGVGAGVEGTGRLELVRVDSIRVGAARGFGLTACVVDLAHLEPLGASVHGLLGLNFLREFRMTLDFERDVLILVER